MFVAIAGCGDKNSGIDPVSFDRRTLLQNMADNLIKPAFSDVQKGVNDLNSAIRSFATTPNAANFETLKTKWKEAYSAWQFANGYNFGPAGEEGTRKGLIEEIGTFPSNTAKIEAFITANDTSFQSFSRDTRGFLALEYLIYGGSALTKLQAETNRRNYLMALGNHLKTRTDFVANEWQTGKYAATFVADNATSVGSATSNFYNSFVANYEALKNFKIALPLGKRAGQTQTEPLKVDAYYSGFSLDMIKNHFQACENIWYGKSKSGTDGIGFKEYLEAVEGGKALIAATETQLAATKAALNAVPTNKTFGQLIEANDPSVFALQTESQKLVRYYKSDLSSLLGIAITFSSGDGD
ncbi:MAG: imelysin family protein [Saprospiraceae bacterium]|nr:imelysin family protein [Saprospiraceae bacterium]